MFKKRDNELDIDEPGFGSIPSNPGDSVSRAETEEETSVVGYSLRIEGTLSTNTHLRINGSVKGDIRAKAVTVGQDATVEANIVSNEVVVAGSVTGEIRAMQVRLCNTAVVSGEIVHKLFAIESGAQFEGTVKHLEDPLSEDDVPWNMVEGGELDDDLADALDEAVERPAPAADDSAW